MKIGIQRSPTLVIALILLHLTAFTQEQKIVKKNLVYKQITPVKPAPVSLQTLNVYSLTTSRPLTNSNKYMIPIHQGIICRKEYAFEKKTGLPLKLRLGTFEEAHRLEYGR